MNTARPLHAAEPETRSWEARFSDKRRLMDDSGIRAILGVAARPGILSFAGGLPDPSLLPVRQLERCARVVTEKYGSGALQYGVSDGVSQLRERLSDLAVSRGAECSAANVIPTTGSQQAIDLIANVFLNKGERIAVTRPTYLGALQIFSSFEPEYLEVRCDAEGPILSDLEAALAQRPAFFYIVSIFQNPSGVSISQQRGKEVLRLCRSYDVPVVEDAAYRELYFGEPPVSLRALETEYLRQQELSYEQDGRVIYLGTLSKVMSPGLRVGWIEAPATVIRGLACLKQGTDLHSSVMNHLIAAEFLETCAEEYWEQIRAAYRERRDAAVAAVANHVGSMATACTSPQGGFFLWIDFDSSINTTTLLAHAVETCGVAFAPGSPFFANNPGHNSMRLSYSNLSPQQIDEGARRLARAIKGAL